MSALLPAAVRNKLIACIRLAQAPGTQGKAEAAHCAIGRLVVSYDTAIIEALTSRSSPRRQADSDADKPVVMGWRDAAAECLEHHDVGLTNWERQFLTSLLRQHRGPSLKQTRIIENISGCCGIAIRGWR
jgi:hypothetical protein